MLRISKLADYATVLMTHFADDVSATLNAKDLTSRTHIALPTVTKILKLLTKNGLLQSSRGINGGYRLAKTADEISIAQVIAAVEGEIALTECSQHEGDCALEQVCSVQQNFQLINQVIFNALDGISINQLSKPLCADQIPQPQPIKWHKSSTNNELP